MPGPELILGSSDLLLRTTTRRRFLALLGMAGTVVLLPSMFTACSDADSITDPDAPQFRLDLSDDTGILNAAYVLEQVEAAFYTAAVSSAAFGGMPVAEQQALTAIQAHEVSHRDLLGQMLGTGAVPALAFDAGALAASMSDRATLLRTAQRLEDTGVAAYNGAGKYLVQGANLLVFGRIVSVEGRHAATIRDIRDGTNGVAFAGDDVVGAQGLDVKLEPDVAVGAIAAVGIVASLLGVRTLPNQSKRTTDQPPPLPA
jgi:hypothetical protein